MHNEMVLVNPLEALRGDREGQHSILINDQWIICFAGRGAWPVECGDC
jgi:toxin HigB-1